MYDQDFEKEYHEFNSAVALFTYLFKFKDKTLVETCEQTLILMVGSQYTTNIINAAIFQLAEFAPETCQWAWQNFPYLEACISLKEYFLMLAVQKLISQCFILGQDFSITNTSKILMTQNARDALMPILSEADRVLVKELIQVNEQVVFY
jgi:hypothetical protein